MKSLLLALTLLLMAPDALAVATAPNKGAALQTRTVKVFDYSGVGWQFLVAGMVAQYNAAIGKPFPRLIYRRMGSALCDDVRQRRDALTVCMTESILRGASGGMLTSPDHPRVGLRSIIVLEGDAPPPDWGQDWATSVLCHEAMHALTSIRDDYTIEPNGQWHWNTPGLDSCVWGDMMALGSFDVAYAERVYRKYGHR